VGRPREFDRAEALRAAMHLFWEQGYERTSIAQLKDAMGISAPSFYAAFTDKPTLFQEAVDEYERGPTAVAARALAESTARQTETVRPLRANCCATALPMLPDPMIA
jgi:AcrR family transcriptional regulator